MKTHLIILIFLLSLGAVVFTPTSALTSEEAARKLEAMTWYTEEYPPYNYKGVAGEIHKALDSKDLEQAHSLIHNLKGLAGNLAAIDLQEASVNMEKLIKGAEKKIPPAKNLKLKFSELENALNQAQDSVQSLGVTAEENV